MPALPFAPRELAPDVLRFDSPSPIRDAAIRVAILATGVGKDHPRTIAALFSYNAGLTFCPWRSATVRRNSDGAGPDRTE